MEEQNNPETQETTAATQDISLGDAMSGVFTEPSETFQSIKNSSKKNYWLVPIIIFVLISVIAGFLVINDEELYSGIKDKQSKAIKERMEQQVKDGKMTKEQMNESLEKTEKFFDKSSPFFMIMAIVGPLFSTFILFFLKGLIFWGAFKLLKGTATYMQSLSVIGLCGLIASIQYIIGTVLAIFTGKLMAGLNLTMILSEESVGQSIYKLLAHLDAFNIWYFIVAGIGFAKVSQIKSSASFTVVFGLWIVWVMLTSFLNLGIFGM